MQGAAGIIWAAILLAALATACRAADVDAGRGLVFDVVAHGARGDGRTDDTKAFVAAWAAACGAKATSASMVVPARRLFLVGPVLFQGPCSTRRITVQVRALRQHVACQSASAPP
jgi:hypothetical protein